MVGPDIKNDCNYIGVILEHLCADYDSMETARKCPGKALLVGEMGGGLIQRKENV